MAAKPLSLADRIRQKKKQNVSPEDIEREKRLVESIATFERDPIPPGNSGLTSDVKSTKLPHPDSPDLTGKTGITHHPVTENNVSQETRQGTTEPNRPSDPVTQWHSDLGTNPGVSPGINTVTQWHSGTEVNPVTQGPSDPGTHRPIDIVTHRPSDPVTSAHTSFSEWSKPADLTDRQFKVLWYIYFNRPFKVRSNSGLGAIDCMGPNNAKNQLKSLVKKGYIDKPFSVNDGILKGSNCRVNETKCMPLFGPSPIPNPDPINRLISNPVTHRPSDPVTQWHSNPVTHRPSDPVTDPVGSLISSSSYKDKTTTKSARGSILDHILESNNELAYWKEKGLTGKQMADWIRQFDLTAEDLVQSLCYCRFKLVDEGIEESKPVRDALDWIFKILKRSGAHPRPKDYKSFQQKLVEREMARCKEVQREINALKNARLELARAENELRFERMLQDPECTEYATCFEKLPDLFKNPKRKGTKGFNEAMKKHFCEMHDLEPF